MTLLAIQLFLKNAFGWAYANWRIVLGVFLLFFVFAFVHRQCNRPPKVKIDEAQIQKINSENRAERIKELTEVVESNADVIKTVDERTELVEVNIIERNAEVDMKVREADLKIQEAKKEGKDITGPELECILLPEKCQ
jgi:hypothetical protein